VKRTGFVVAVLAILVVLVVTGYAKKEPVQPPIPPPPRTETASPETTPMPTPTSQTVQPTALNAIHFGFDKFDIRSADAQAMDENAAYLRDHQGAMLTLEGYCDPVGTDEYNRGLGLRRANAAKTYLVKAGIDAARLSVVSYGEDKLVTNDKAQFEMDRRVEFVAK
jgi:peptidoglycan-associated lipoprotein